VKKTLLFAFLLALCNLTLLAETGRGPRVVHIPEKYAIHVPPQEALAGLKKIYSNLGKSKTDLYNDLDAWIVCGPKSSRGYSFFEALPFTPKSNSHVSQVQVAVGYLTGSGSTQVNLSIYGDANGVPGTLLAGPVTVTSVPQSGCCALPSQTLLRLQLPVEASTGWLQIHLLLVLGATSRACGSGSSHRPFLWQVTLMMAVGLRKTETGDPLEKCSVQFRSSFSRKFANFNA
jgi:hypothetical protein